MCRVFSCVVGRGCLLWPVRSLGKTLLAFALLHSVLQGQTCLLLQVSLDFLLLHSSPLCWKGHLFWVLVLEGLVGLHWTIQFQLLQHYWLGHRLGSMWYRVAPTHSAIGTHTFSPSWASTPHHPSRSPQITELSSLCCGEVPISHPSYTCSAQMSILVCWFTPPPPQPWYSLYGEDTEAP